MRPIPQSTLLPSDAREVLRAAAEAVQGLKDPLARQLVLENAIRRVRQMYPQFFVQEM